MHNIFIFIRQLGSKRHLISSYFLSIIRRRLRNKPAAVTIKPLSTQFNSPSELRFAFDAVVQKLQMKLIFCDLNQQPSHASTLPLSDDNPQLLRQWRAQPVCRSSGLVTAVKVHEEAGGDGRRGGRTGDEGGGIRVCS